MSSNKFDVFNPQLAKLRELQGNLKFEDLPDKNQETRKYKSCKKLFDIPKG